MASRIAEPATDRRYVVFAGHRADPDRRPARVAVHRAGLHDRQGTLAAVGDGRGVAADRAQDAARRHQHAVRVASDAITQAVHDGSAARRPGAGVSSPIRERPSLITSAATSCAFFAPVSAARAPRRS